jgi:trehalose 6-phosphate synthase/phosphatase
VSDRLIVVSNRLPVSLRRANGGWQAQESPGGLATSMNPVLRDSGGLWIGSPGETAGGDPEAEAIVRTWAERDRYLVVDLPPEVNRLYYEGFANQTLWPLFHHFPMLFAFDPDAWRAYRRANELFCETVARHYKPGDQVWVHDYHLMLLPLMLRQAMPEASIGWFLHIPFPSSEVFRILPHREELLEGLLGADLLAFHTYSHLQHFRTTLLRILATESTMSEVDLGTRAVRLECLPIGIAPNEFLSALESPEGVAARDALARQHQDRRILVAVDRLDYTKGIPERLRTYRRLLANAPSLHGRVVLVQVAVPSREGIGSYADLGRSVNELVGEINGQFGTPEWTPIVYIRRGVPRPELAALYAAADVAWVSPLRDGMNLVAKEYVACKEDFSGALVLSEFAGAAEELGEAFIVNPYDEESTAEALERVLSASEQELRDRMAALHRRVIRNTAFAWAERFLRGLRSATDARAARPAPEARPLPVDAALAAYRPAQRRLLLLDYDGTLIGYAPRPELATPTPDLLDVLARLSANPANQVVVISGRRASDLEGWFAQAAPRLWLAAEHGGFLRAPGGEWTPLHSASHDWKQQVRPVLEHFCERTPGSLIEEKGLSLTWHYRLAEPEYGQWLANELASMLDGMLAETELRPTRGHRNVEVRPTRANKGNVVRHIIANAEDAGFRLAAGDDRTDEDMFAALEAGDWTVRVGAAATRARFTVRDYRAIRALLERLASADAVLAA